MNLATQERTIPAVHEPLALTRPRIAMLLAFAAATVLLIPAHQHLVGAAVWLACAFLVARDPERKVHRRMGTLLVCVAILAAADINTDTSNANFVRVGVPFALVIVLPAIYLGTKDPGVIRYRFFPRRLRWQDLLYTAISIPLAWAILKLYWTLTPEMPLQWSLPSEPDQDSIRRLFIGINCVGIWDELFFVSTVFVVLRSMFRYPVANAVQAVVYTSVLYDMAFIGIGPVIVYLFAWTQGSMFEESDNLLYVLIVHLIVDFLLVAAIVGAYYPSYGLDYLWRHGV